MEGSWHHHNEKCPLESQRVYDCTYILKTQKQSYKLVLNFDTVMGHLIHAVQISFHVYLNIT